MISVMAAFIRNNVFATALTVVLIVGGAIALRNMTREFFPDIELDHILVTVPYPGADPEEIEEGISRKIEEALDTVEGVKRYTTVSMENLGRAIIEVEEGYDTSRVYDRVRNAVDSIGTFPVDAERPTIAELTIRQEVLVVALTGDMPERVMKEWAEEIKNELQRLPNVSQISVFGTRDYEIGIEVSEARLREYGLTFTEVATAVRRGSLNLAGGLLRTTGEEIRLRTVGRRYTAEDFANLVVLARPDGEIITLDRIAHIRDEFTEDPVSAVFNGEPAVMVGVFKTREQDAIAIAEEVRAYVERKAEELPEGAGIALWNDNATLIEDRLEMLARNGVQGLIIVVVLLFLLLDARLSFWVSLGIPISFGGALAVLYMFGYTLNMISLFGLIMVLGMLVDDAIVVGEAIHYHRKRGMKPFDAALQGVMEVGLPITAAIATTIIAFMPLMFVGGIMGKFIRVVPIAVILCLLFSLYESLFLLPAHLNRLPAPVKRPENQRPHPIHRFRWMFSNAMEWFIERLYAPFIDATLRHRYIGLAVATAIVLVTGGLFSGGFIKYETFSEVDGNSAIAAVEFPAGTPPTVTERAVQRLQQGLERVAEKTQTASGKPLIQNVYAVTGQSTEGFERMTGSHLGQVRAELLPTEQRGIHSEEIRMAWEREVGSIPGALSLSYRGMTAGPPGAPIEVWLQGDDMSALLAASAELKDKLATYDGVYQIEDDYRPGRTEVRINLKPHARTLGITLDDLARQVFAGYYGEEALRIQRGRDDVRVRVRYTEQERRQLAEFERIRIRTPQGLEVPFLSVADVEYGEGYSSITRVNSLRRVAVTAEVDTDRANAEEILAELDRAYLPDLQARLGFHYSFEGAQTESREALESLRIGFPIALFVIFVIIATLFRSYLQPIVIMVVVPFSLMGAVYAHLVFGLTLTLMSLFGMVALAGVVVNDAIVLVDHFNRTLRSKAPFYDALRMSGMRRFRAIFLTSATTIGGLSMIVFSADLQAQWLKPMAVSLAGGLFFSTLLTLVLLPLLLALLNDMRRAVHYALHGKLPEPEDVEPACCEHPE